MFFHIFSTFADSMVCPNLSHKTTAGLGCLAGGTLGGSHQNLGELWKVGVAQAGFD